MSDGIPEQVEDEPTDGAAFRGVADAPGRAPIAVALAAVALVGLAILTRGGSEPPTVAILELTPPPRATAAATAAPAESTTRTLPALPARNPAVAPLSTIPPVPALVGSNELVPAGETTVELNVRLPEGWTKLNDSVFARLGETAATPSATISAWSLMHVNVFPCRWSAEVFADDELMRTPRGQAEALASWWGQDPGMPANSNVAIAPLATEPFQTTLGGYPARYLEVLIPRGLDFAQCDGGQVVLWHTATGEAKRSLGPGELTRLWVVDVAGEPIVVDVSTLPDGEIYADELESGVGSILIER